MFNSKLSYALEEKRTFETFNVTKKNQKFKSRSLEADRLFNVENNNAEESAKLLTEENKAKEEK